jgi:sugar/nucleoside kinase (ribokinase family)
MIVMDQVDKAATGTITEVMLDGLQQLATQQPQLPIIADSRRGLGHYPPLIFKMNAAELGALQGQRGPFSIASVKTAACELAGKNARPVFITMAEHGIVGAAPQQTVVHVPALPLRGPIDVVGAGDSVTANLTAALAAKATLHEAITLAILASSCVLHQVGTTGTASVRQMLSLLPFLRT